MTLPIATISPGWVMLVLFGISSWASYRFLLTIFRKDRFLRALCENHLEIWLAIGSPTGIYWSPPRADRDRSTITYCHWAELMSAPQDPDWLLQTPELAADFRHIKAETKAWTYRRIPGLLIISALCILAAWALERFQ